MTLGVIDPCYLHRFGELVQMEISRVVVPKPVLPVSSLTNLYVFSVHNVREYSYTVSLISL